MRERAAEIADIFRLVVARWSRENAPKCTLGALNDLVDTLLSSLPPVRGEQETAEPAKWTDGPYANSPSRFDCLECMMRGIAVDEDGCCKSCGHDAERIGLCKTLHVPAPVRAEAAKTEPLCRCQPGVCLLHPSLETCGMRERSSPVREAEPLKALVDEFRALANQYRPLNASFAYAYDSAADKLSAALEGAATKGQ